LNNKIIKLFILNLRLLNKIIDFEFKIKIKILLIPECLRFNFAVENYVRTSIKSISEKDERTWRATVLPLDLFYSASYNKRSDSFKAQQQKTEITEGNYSLRMHSYINLPRLVIVN